MREEVKLLVDGASDLSTWSFLCLNAFRPVDAVRAASARVGASCWRSWADNKRRAEVDTSTPDGQTSTRSLWWRRYEGLVTEAPDNASKGEGRLGKKSHAMVA